MADKQMTRQQEILRAALQEFIKEGISGARLQAIADNIGVTKAMIHYYFQTKENLFLEVFGKASNVLMDGLMEVLEKEEQLFPKIEAFIDQAVNRFHDHPQLAGFVVNELNNHAELIEPVFKEAFTYDASIFNSQLKEAASSYKIAPVDARQVVANILSLCLLPYSGRGFLQSISGMDDQKYEKFLSNRREVIKDTIINWLAG